MMRERSVFLIVLALLFAGGVSTGEAQEPRPAPEPRGAREARPAPAPAAGPGWLGIMFDSARPSEDGVLVREVHPGSPAARAGLRGGDMIVQLNRGSATTERFRELRLQPGDTVQVRVRRQGQRDRDMALVAAGRPVGGNIEVHPRGTGRAGSGPLVIIGGDTVRIPTDAMMARADTVMQRMRIMLQDSLPRHLRELERRMPEIRIFSEGDTAFVYRPRGGEAFAFDFAVGGRAVAGAEFAELSPGLAEYFRGAGEGLLVLRVAPGTPAARAGLQEGDVVVRANGSAVRTVAELRRAVSGAERRDVQLDLIRQGTSRELRLRWER